MNGMKKLGFGLMRLPLTAEHDPRSIDQEQVNRMVDDFLAQGFTYFDTAYGYHQGMSETAVRHALSERYPRQAFLLADKMPTYQITRAEEYPAIFAQQLERCGVDYFDYYLLHTLGEKNYASTLKCDGFSYMKKLKAEGKARHIGFSYHDKAELLERILTEHPEMEFVQLQVNYIDWENETIQARACCEAAARHQKPVIVMEPVKGGSLANVPEEAEALFRSVHPEGSPASWAIRFAASLENVFLVLSGMSTPEQLTDNMNCMRDFRPLTAEERAVVEQVTGIINSAAAIPCTSCQYCVEGCPKHIPIPQYFALYNNQKRFRLVPSHRNYYMNLTQEFGRAADCVACGQCEARCPQHIAIAEQLKAVSAVFDAEP